MLPIPPLDGGNVLAGLLPPAACRAWSTPSGRTGSCMLYALMFTGVLGRLIGPPYSSLLSWLR